VRRVYDQHYVASNMIVGIAGDMDEAELRPLVNEVFGSFRTGTAPVEAIDDPTPPRGRTVTIVDKPERTQTQIYVGALGNRVGDPSVFPLLVANTAFGGTFTSRLMQAVRAERGWSYGASSRIGQDRRRDAWYMWTFPAAKDAVPCIELELSLVETLLRDGLTEKEHEFSRAYLAKSHCFEVDTAAKRLDPRIDIELYGLPADYYDRYVEQVEAVTHEQGNAALRERLSADDLAIVLLATASDVREQLEKIPNVTDVKVVPFDGD
jgi:zinc protease